MGTQERNGKEMKKLLIVSVALNIALIAYLGVKTLTPSQYEPITGHGSGPTREESTLKAFENAKAKLAILEIDDAGLLPTGEGGWETTGDGVFRAERVFNIVRK